MKPFKVGSMLCCLALTAGLAAEPKTQMVLDDFGFDLSGWPIDQTPDPSRMLVDYVRAYAK